MAKPMLLVCSAVIPHEGERKAIMAWARTVANEGCREDGETVHLNYRAQPDDPDDSGRWYGIMHTFEGYAEHSVEIKP